MTHGSLVPATSYKQNDQKENNNDDHHNDNNEDHHNDNTKKNKNDDNGPDDLVSAHLKSTIFNQKSKTWLNVWYRALCKVENALSKTKYHRWVL